MNAGGHHARVLAWAMALGFGASACTVAESKEEPAASSRPAVAAARVAVATARGGGLDDEWRFLGRVEPLHRAELAAGAEGQVLEVDVRVGDRVSDGELVVRVDPSLARARVAAAAASKVEAAKELAQAGRDRARAESLGAEILAQAEIEREVTRETTLEARRSRLSAAEREARAELGRYRVRAPFDAVVAARHVDPGDWVSPGDPLLDLVDDRSVEILVDGSAELVQRVDVGDRATITHRAGGDGETSIDAEVVGVVRALDPVTRTATLRLQPSDSASWLLPGASIDVAFTIERREPGVVVPRDALVYGAVGVRVIEVVDDKAAPVDVEVVATANDEALVRGEGLAIGDSVVTHGNERLRPGQSVVVVQ